MKSLKQHVLFSLLAVMAIFASSCDDDNGSDVTYQYAFVNIVTDGSTTYFENSNGTYYCTNIPSELSSQAYNGRRAYINYVLNTSNINSYYDYTITLVGCLITAQGEVVPASSAEEVESYGTNGISTNSTSYNYTDGYLDLPVSFYAQSDEDATYEFTLVVPDESLIPETAVVPDGYIYMELRLKITGDGTENSTSTSSIVSFELPTDYRPNGTTIKGFYVRVMNSNGDSSYVTLSFEV